MHLLDDFREKRNYWNLKAEALDRTLWRTSFERGYKPFAGDCKMCERINGWMDERMNA
jgi:hypothetical protein